MAIVVDNIETCSKHIQNDNLVAFPTETVYRLGANAFSKNAVLKVYKVKERPSNDPLIIHIDSFERLNEWELIDITKEQYNILEKYSNEFWPGPLTIILKSYDKIPSEVTSNTGKVGIRIPSNLNALSLIKNNNLPIAAPSANKFGHISPTNKDHVLFDFKNQKLTDSEIYVIDNQSENIGIESTILDFDFDSNIINLLRPGFITEDNINNLISKYKLKMKFNYNVKYKVSNDMLESSGQLITHYAKYCNTLMIKTNKSLLLENLPIKNNFAIIDIFGLCCKIKEKSNCKYYYNNNSVLEAIKKYYQIMR